MSQVMSKAQELADAISESEELISLRDAAERLDGDDTANAALKRFQEKQTMVQRAATSGIELPDGEMEELKMMQEQIRVIPSVQEFAAAQNGFNDMMNKVNDIIAAAVMGNEPGASGQDSCGPGCGCSH